MPPVIKQAIKSKVADTVTTVPFKNGVLGEWTRGTFDPQRGYARDPEEWSPALPFEASLELVDIVSGDGVHRWVLRDEHRRYAMALSDFRDAVQAGAVIAQQRLTGRFEYRLVNRRHYVIVWTGHGAHVAPPILVVPSADVGCRSAVPA